MVVLLTAACAEIPTSGAVESGSQVQTSENDPLIRVIPRPPMPGATPTEVVQGFLNASASFADDHAVARLYMTPEASERWDPSRGVTVFNETAGVDLTRKGRKGVQLQAEQTASINTGGALLPRDNVPITRMFLLERQENNWRIAQAPQGLYLSEVDVARSYRAFDVFFLNDLQSRLVPDPVFIPLERQGTATSLTDAVLGGPTAWLRPAVDSAIPDGTTLVVDAVPIENGVALVDLSTDFLDSTSMQERELAAAQLTFTLFELQPEVAGVTITVEGAPAQLPDLPTVLTPADFSQVDPGGLSATLGGIFVRGDQVRQLTDGGSEPVGGLLGRGKRDVRDPSESWDGGTITSLDESRNRLMVTHPLSRGGVVASIHGGELLPASIDGDGVVWAVDRSEQPPTIMRLTRSDEWRQVNVRGLNASVRAFRVSIDGTRVAVVVRTPDGGGQLLLGRVVRGVNGIRVEGFRPLALALRDLSNVSWITYDELLAVGGTKSSALRLTQVGLDGTVTPLSAVPPTGATTVVAGAGLPLLAGSSKRLYEGSNTSFSFLTRGQDPAYPG
jgi:hypothetical protein